jgi:hypothetical protein
MNSVQFSIMKYTPWYAPFVFMTLLVACSLSFVLEHVIFYSQLDNDQQEKEPRLY